MERITSLQNDTVKQIVRLKEKRERDRTGLFLIEGEHILREALKNGVVQTVYTDDENFPYSFENVVLVSEAVLHKMSSNVSQIHYLAVCKQLNKTIDNPTRVLFIDAVQDPGNLGTLIRCCAAFQFDGIYISLDTVDVYNEKTIRSTQGAMFNVPIIRCDIASMIDQYLKEDFYIVGTSLTNAIDLKQVTKKEKMGIVLGNEGSGVSNSLLDKCSINTRIEMQGFESLNVAVAGGILMYTFQK